MRRFRALVLTVLSMAVACGGKSGPQGADSESHFFECDTDGDCTPLGSAFLCVEQVCELDPHLDVQNDPPTLGDCVATECSQIPEVLPPESGPLVSCDEKKLATQLLWFRDNNGECDREGCTLTESQAAFVPEDGGFSLTGVRYREFGTQRALAFQRFNHQGALVHASTAPYTDLDYRLAGRDELGQIWIGHLDGPKRVAGQADVPRTLTIERYSAVGARVGTPIVISGVIDAQLKAAPGGGIVATLHHFDPRLRKEDYLDYPEWDVELQRLDVVRLDASGTEVWKQTGLSVVGTDSKSRVAGFDRRGGPLIIAQAVTGIISTPTGPSENVHAQLVRLDDQGRPAWTRRLSGFSFLALSDHDGGAYLVRAARRSLPNGLFQSDGWRLERFESNGHVAWGVQEENPDRSAPGLYSIREDGLLFTQHWEPGGIQGTQAYYVKARTADGSECGRFRIEGKSTRGYTASSLVLLPDGLMFSHGNLERPFDSQAVLARLLSGF